MKKFTIKDLQEGKCAIFNSSTLQDLNKVIQLAFPGSSKCSGHYNYYFSKGTTWTCDNKTNLPDQLTKDFLEEEFENGEEIIFHCDKSYFVGNYPKNDFDAIIINSLGNVIVVRKSQISKLPPVLELTLKEVAEKFNVKEVKIIDK